MMPRSERLDPDTPTRPHNSDAWPDSWSSALVSTGSGHWRFPLAIPLGNRLQFAVVEIMTHGAMWSDGSSAEPVVVLHEFDRPGGPGICNAIEHAVAIVADAYLRHLNLEVTEVTWILHNDAQTSSEEWTRFTVSRLVEAPRTSRQPPYEVDFHGDCLPISRSEPHDLEDDYFSPAVFRPLDLATEQPELRLDANTCHERRTGLCSVTVDHPVDDERDGQASWSFCRELADLASLWQFIEDEVPHWLNEPDTPVEALRVAQATWRAPCGTITDPTLEHLKACRVLEHGRIHVTVLPNGRTSFSDGQHRWCAASRAGVAMPVLLNLPVRHKLKAGAK
jgi:hypothetical protein